MNLKSMTYLTLLSTLILSVGCRNDQSNQPAQHSTESPTGSQYLATTEPPNAVGVGTARKNISDGDRVILTGHIGGSANPFVDGIAAFTIVDPKVNYCQPDEGCPTPWDYCCTQNEVKENIATVKVVDDAGKTVVEDARQLLGVEELSLVVVNGRAQRDDQGNLSILANQVFIKK